MENQSMVSTTDQKEQATAHVADGSTEQDASMEGKLSIVAQQQFLSKAKDSLQIHIREAQLCGRK